MEPIIKSLRDFKEADQATRDFFVYAAVSRIFDLDKKYAKKWVEKVMYGAGVIIGSALLYSLLNLVLIDSAK